MRIRILLFGVVLIGVAVIGFVILRWSFSPTKQQQYEEILLDKTLEQVQAILGDHERIFYQTREQWEKRLVGPVGWRADIMAIGHWEKDPRPGPVICVFFDKTGKAIIVHYQVIVGGDSLYRMLCRCRVM